MRKKPTLKHSTTYLPSPGKASIGCNYKRLFKIEVTLPFSFLVFVLHIVKQKQETKKLTQKYILYLSGNQRTKCNKCSGKEIWSNEMQLKKSRKFANGMTTTKCTEMKRDAVERTKSCSNYSHWNPKSRPER